MSASDDRPLLEAMAYPRTPTTTRFVRLFAWTRPDAPALQETFLPGIEREKLSLLGEPLHSISKPPIWTSLPALLLAACAGSSPAQEGAPCLVHRVRPAGQNAVVEFSNGRAALFRARVDGFERLEPGDVLYLGSESDIDVWGARGRMVTSTGLSFEADLGDLVILKSAPADRLLIYSERGLVVLSHSEVLWKSSIPVGLAGCAVGRNVVLCAVEGDAAVALEIDTGEIRWVRRLKHLISRIESVGGVYVFVGTPDATVVDEDGVVVVEPVFDGPAVVDHFRQAIAGPAGEAIVGIRLSDGLESYRFDVARLGDLGGDWSFAVDRDGLVIGGVVHDVVKVIHVSLNAEPFSVATRVLALSNFPNTKRVYVLRNAPYVLRLSGSEDIFVVGWREPRWQHETDDLFLPFSVGTKVLFVDLAGQLIVVDSESRVSRRYACSELVSSISATTKTPVVGSRAGEDETRRVVARGDVREGGGVR